MVHKEMAEDVGVQNEEDDNTKDDQTHWVVPYERLTPQAMDSATDCSLLHMGRVPELQLLQDQ